jgi:AcrR family transcriptional regulator
MHRAWHESPVDSCADSHSAREAILEAAGELLVTRGLVAVTIDAVARRAQINNEVLQRWWPSEEALAVDVLHREWVVLASSIRRGAREFGF